MKKLVKGGARRYASKQLHGVLIRHQAGRVHITTEQNGRFMADIHISGRITHRAKVPPL